MTAAVLDRTPIQRLEALQLANRVRFSRAALKDAIRNRQIDVCVILADPPAYTLTMKVAVLLAAQPFYGPVTTGRTLRRAQISDAKTIGGLTVRQRHMLIGLLDG